MNKLTAKDFKRGIRVVKSQLTDFDNYPVYQNSLTPLGFYSKYNVKANTVFVICAGAAGDIGFSNKNFWAADDCYYLETDKYVDSKFIYYYLLSIQNDIKRQVRQASVPRLGSNVLKSIILPSVSDNKQQEIVKILDSFTNLIDALNEELSLRQKQFEYYREKLLTFDDNCDYVSISPIRGKRVVKDDLNDNNKYPVYQNSIEALGYYDKVNRRSNMTFIICAGAAGEIGFSTSEFWAADDCFTINHDDLLDKFIYYCIYVKKHYLKSQVRKASVPRLSNTVLSKLKLPCPPLAVQQSIVEKLDAFESLISSLKEEIALRQKQYEYYREKLLTFD